ncbi:MAG TPA: rhodanese-related sulfurtransferase [Candidatus Saccharimonadales bacterium]|nr:rhodanese-related sulfurtransferase [Candidatus Saccharimonadales bacterium]
MKKVILFYKFVPLPDPQMAMLWQKELCAGLGLKGRIIVSPQGINGTLGGDIENLRKYKRAMNASGTFRGIHYKWSDGTGREFPRLSVKMRDELVSFKKPEEVKVSEHGVVGGGKHLKPEALHKLIKERGEDVVFFDGRNAYEAQVGRFKGAVVPDTRTTRDFVAELESGKYDDIKDKPVVTYCTGGIRCEVLSVLMKNRGFKDVYQMDGGIVKYGEKYGDDGLWEGNLYIFDDRMTHKFSKKAKDIGECVHCARKTSNFENCADVSCNRLVLICKACKENQKISCENHAPALTIN